MEKTIFKDIPWYEWRYMVWKNGSILSLKNKGKGKEIILKPVLKKTWYLQVQLKWKNFLLHRIVAGVFTPNPDNLPEVNHLDGNKLNNNDWNLEWTTRDNNLKHSFVVLWNKNDFKRNHPDLWKKWILNIKSKQIIQLTKKWEIIKEWWSQWEASNELWIAQSNISSACLWKIKTAGWFIWKFINNIEAWQQV